MEMATERDLDAEWEQHLEDQPAFPEAVKVALAGEVHEPLQQGRVEMKPRRRSLGKRSDKHVLRREHSWGVGGGSPRTASESNQRWYLERAVEPPPLEDDDDVFLWGVFLVFVGVSVFALALYSMLISKWLPPSGNELLDWIREDRYYCLLVPVTGSVTVFAIYLHWMSMKFFKHA